MEWLISACEGPLKWHARSTLLLHFTTEETILVSTRETIQRKQRINKPIIVLTDLSHCYQGLQVLVGLVRVDVVQWAAVPGVSIRGCEVDGNLLERNNNINNVRIYLLLQNFFQRLVTWLLHPYERAWNMPDGSINYLIRGRNLHFLHPQRLKQLQLPYTVDPSSQLPQQAMYPPQLFVLLIFMASIIQPESERKN